MLTLKQLDELSSLLPYSTPSERAVITKLLKRELRDTTPPLPIQQQIRDKCAADPVWFVNTFCWTYDPRETDPDLSFDLFLRQEDFFSWLREREVGQEDGIAEKCRDVGFTWLCCGYALHGWLFRKGFKAGFGSRKLDLVDRKGDPDCIFEKIRFLISRLPAWMRPRKWNERVHDGRGKLINPDNGARIIGEGGDNIGRGGRTTIYFIDEAAFLARAQKADAALSQNSRVKIWVSTPNGIGNVFERKRHSGKFSVFTFRWWEDPRKDDAWYQRQKDTLDPVVLAQEVDIDYTASLEGIAIPAAWVMAAVNLDIAPALWGVAGLDIAEEGKNKSVLIARSGPVVTDVIAWDRCNTTETAYKAAEHAERLHALVLSYDCIGVGAGVRGTLDSSERVFLFRPNPVAVGAGATDLVWPDGRTSQERFKNLRAELWWRLRTRFEKAYEFKTFGTPHPPDEMISIPNNGMLIAQLSTPLYFRTDTGKILIESKKAMSARGVASPDHADALALAFAEDGEAVDIAQPIVGTSVPSILSGFTPGRY